MPALEIYIWGLLVNADFITVTRNIKGACGPCTAHGVFHLAGDTLAWTGLCRLGSTASSIPAWVLNTKRAGTGTRAAAGRRPGCPRPPTLAPEETRRWTLPKSEVHLPPCACTWHASTVPVCLRDAGLGSVLRPVCPSPHPCWASGRECSPCGCRGWVSPGWRASPSN